ncbi:MAG: DUF123 domain-containing protein [Deltaproteobacteria bacterium]|nr:DUF123 domain-containing protein [Deltaproteobacteria bacterium]
MGSLGLFYFDKGVYAYIGSAQNNLEKRIERHKSDRKKTFWHIDYLLSNKFAEIIRVFYREAGKSSECIAARKLAKTELPIVGFGCSDCKCVSHLFRILSRKDIGRFLDMKEY